MKMLRGILGVSRLEHIRNEEIRKTLNILPIDGVLHNGSDMCKDDRRTTPPAELLATRCQMVRTPNEGVETPDERGHEGGRVTVDMTLDWIGRR